MAPRTRKLDVDRDPAGLEFIQLQVGHRTVLAASGEIDMATAPALVEAAAAVLASGALDVWLDLSEVTFMDSTGVKVLLDTRGALSGTGRSFAVICPPGPVRRVLGIAGVEGDLPLFTDRASAHAGRSG
jgi:anti-sigma B factor antagonist